MEKFARLFEIDDYQYLITKEERFEEDEEIFSLEFSTNLDAAGAIIRIKFKLDYKDEDNRDKYFSEFDEEKVIELFRRVNQNVIEGKRYV